MSPSSGPRHLLLVCTGNVCRSPAAELLLAHGVGASGGAGGITVSSAGSAALVGQPVAARMARLLSARGVDPAGFVARQLVPEMVQVADLVLTMTAEQRAAVVGLVPAAVRRTFTLVEFAGLVSVHPVGDLHGTPADRLQQLVAGAPAARALRHGSHRADDIPDPYGRDDEAFARALAQIVASVDPVLAALGVPVAHPA